MGRFVQNEIVRLYLVDVHRRAHEALKKRTKPRKATPGELAESAQRVAQAEALGDWVDVKRQLNEGERRAAHARMYITTEQDSKLRFNPLVASLQTVLAFLVDWSFTDDDGHPVEIRGMSADDMTTILDALHPESFAEIRLAIEHHEQTTLLALQEKKPNPATASESEATSTSVN